MSSDDKELDSETGEIRQAVTCLRSMRMEQGEASSFHGRRRKKKTFHVPISYVQGKEEDDEEWTRRKKKKVGRQRKRLEVESLEESVVKGMQDVSPIVFILPSVLIFPAWASILCVLCEACLHMLSHKRNKMKKYQTDYKSPLHLVSSEFCGYCRSYRWKQKIKQIQEKRFMRRNFPLRNAVAHSVTYK